MNLDLIARYYDLIHAEFADDLPMWQALAEEAAGPILEIGCGTGRLLLPLTAAGVAVTGLDLSAAALQTAQTKWQAAGLPQPPPLIQADMRRFDLPQKEFALAFLPLNTFMHCHTLDDQLATLRHIHRHLQPGGQIALDLFYPDPLMLAEVDGRLYFETELTDPATGHTVQWHWRHDIDLAEQMRHLVYILDDLDPAGLVRRVSIPVTLRYFYPFELELLLKLAGFTLETLYGDYDFTPFHGHSPRMIAVAGKS